MRCYGIYLRRRAGITVSVGWNERSAVPAIWSYKPVPAPVNWGAGMHFPWLKSAKMPFNLALLEQRKSHEVTLVI